MDQSAVISAPHNELLPHMNNGFIVSQKSNDNIEVVPAGLEVGYLMKYQK